MQDPRFEQLGIRQVRLLMSYDLVLKGDFSRYDDWMAAAALRGSDVLLTIQRHSRHAKRLPSFSKYRRTVRILRRRYPSVKSMSAHVFHGVCADLDFTLVFVGAAGDRRALGLRRHAAAGGSQSKRVSGGAAVVSAAGSCVYVNGGH